MNEGKKIEEETVKEKPKKKRLISFEKYPKKPRKEFRFRMIAVHEKGKAVFVDDFLLTPLSFEGSIAWLREHHSLEDIKFIAWFNEEGKQIAKYEL